MEQRPADDEGRRPFEGRGESESPPRVLVVGGGVSGCACAAALAESGVRVVVMSSALDVVGEPAYGPVVKGGAGGWKRIVRTLAALPAVLRAVWLEASKVPCPEGPGREGPGPEGRCPKEPCLEEPVFFVDRRMLSIETKRALECLPGLEFRQGFATDIRIVPRSGVERKSADSGDGCPERVLVETAFGETIEAGAVVLAVGLGLAGRAEVGDAVLSGGRYGEPSAEGLRNALEALGAVFAERSVEVGSCIGRGGKLWRETSGTRETGKLWRAEAGPICDGSGTKEWAVEAVPLREAIERHRGKGISAAAPVAAWPRGYPPAVHWAEKLRQGEEVIARSGRDGRARVHLVPDGAALGEGYLLPGGGVEENEGGRMGGPVGGSEGQEAPVATRLGHLVTGKVVANVDSTGRLVIRERARCPVWLAGRVGGARDYLESLDSGVRVASSVVKSMLQSGGGGAEKSVSRAVGEWAQDR